ncbi:uncharacterized protein [Triticum aestivum]|uniref:uncharacterized protein n=1 Tax=Triticum aestivum TaxID=4565 RepID=UPI001D01D3EC|nr:uncharacterized protein LOC123139325 [Triticum aestivum]
MAMSSPDPLVSSHRNLPPRQPWNTTVKKLPGYLLQRRREDLGDGAGRGPGGNPRLCLVVVFARGSHGREDMGQELAEDAGARTMAWGRSPTALPTPARVPGVEPPAEFGVVVDQTEQGWQKRSISKLGIISA